MTTAPGSSDFRGHHDHLEGFANCWASPPYPSPPSPTQQTRRHWDGTQGSYLPSKFSSDAASLVPHLENHCFRGGIFYSEVTISVLSQTNSNHEVSTYIKNSAAEVKCTICFPAVFLNEDLWEKSYWKWTEGLFSQFSYRWNIVNIIHWVKHKMYALGHWSLNSLPRLREFYSKIRILFMMTDRSQKSLKKGLDTKLNSTLPQNLLFNHTC